MTTVARVTTNLNPNLFEFLSKEAKASGTTFRNILEKAIEYYQNEKLKKQLIAGYNDMANDKEEFKQWLEIANDSSNLKLENDF